MDKIVRVEGISKRFADKTVLDNISFGVDEGEVVAIFGPNGCGKTTLLNILAGISEVDEGKFKLRVQKSKFSYVFQNYRDSLLQWKNNYDNLAFPLELQNVSEDEIQDRIGDFQQLFELKIEERKFPYQMSGGQQQILAFLRAIVNEPKLLFVDEVFSAMDFENSLLLRQNLQKYHSEYKPAMIMVTHDIEEAVHLADKIIVLSKPPTRIVEVIENKRKPRGLPYLTSPQFMETKRRVLDAFLRGAK